MPKFAPKQIDVLLKLAAAKTYLPLNNDGFGELSSLIDESYEPSKVLLDKKYLMENLFKPSNKAVAEGLEEIKLAKGYVDKLANYAGFRGFGGFEAAWLKVQGYLDRTRSHQTSSGLDIVICHNLPEEDAQKLVQSTQYKGQDASLHPNSTPPTGGLLESLTQIAQKCGIVLWLIDSSVFDHIKHHTESGAFDVQVLQQDNIIPIWKGLSLDGVCATFPSIDVHRFIEESLLPLAIQQSLAQSNKPAALPQPSHGTTVNNINNAATVFTGSPNIKGKYIVSGQNINIGK